MESGGEEWLGGVVSGAGVLDPAIVRSWGFFVVSFSARAHCVRAVGRVTGS